MQDVMFVGRVNLSLNCLFNWTTDIIEAKVYFMVGSQSQKYSSIYHTRFACRWINEYRTSIQHIDIYIRLQLKRQNLEEGNIVNCFIFMIIIQQQKIK